MSKITRCDLCGEKQKKSNEDGWVSLSLNARGLNQLPGFGSSYLSWDFCSDCGSDVITGVAKIVNKK